MTGVKICSVQQVDHILAAAEAGADYVGINFVPGVRRQIVQSEAKRIIQEFRHEYGYSGPKLVGIFADQVIDEVNQILDDCDLDIAQLSGHESIEYAGLVSKPVIKAIHVSINKAAEESVQCIAPLISQFHHLGIFPLLDPDVGSALGGTGTKFDLSIAKALVSEGDFLLGGGLNPESVASVVQKVRPWGVDVSSGVETNGMKDTEKIKQFIGQAKAQEE